MKKILYALIILSLALPAMRTAYAQGTGVPSPIELGETLTGTISTAGEEVTFLFDANSGDQITATVTPVDTGLDPVLDLTTFTRTLLATDDNSGENGGARITYTLPADGAYLLNVRGVSGTTGSFEITLQAGFVETTIEATPDVATPSFSDQVPPSSNTTTDGVVTNPLSNDSTARLRQIGVGSTVSGTLEAGTNFAMYAFIGRNGQEIAITPDPRNSFQPLMALYNNGFEEVLRAQPGESLQATLTRTGLYFIAVGTLQPNGGGSFGFSLLEQNATPTTAVDNSDLTYGDTVRGNISNTNASQRYQFRGGAGDVVTFSMANVNGDLDAYLLLVDTSGNLIAEDNDSGQATNAQMTVTLPNDGDYFIIATRNGQAEGLTAGEFVLAVTSSASPPVSADAVLPEDYEAFPILDYGDSVTGRITDVVFQELYVFYGDEGDTVSITMAAANDSGLDPLLVLLDDERFSVAENDDTETSQNSEILTTLPTSGYYAIVATRFELSAGVTTGEYELTVTKITDEVDTTSIDVFDELSPTRFVTGDTPSGSFAPLNFASVFTFSVAQGALIDFAVTTTDGSVATVMLTDSNLNFITASENGIILAQSAPSSDDYLAFVFPQLGPAFTSATDFTVALSSDAVRAAADTSSSSETIPITYGNEVRGTISESQSSVRYVFQGRENDSVQISMAAIQGAAGTLDTYLILQDTNGNIIAQNDDIEAGVIRNSFLQATLPADGQYIIVATRYSGDDAVPTVGDFSLLLDYRDALFATVDTSAELIRYGQTLTTTIDDAVTLRFFYFEGNQGDAVTIEVNTTDGNLDGVMYLYARTSTNDYILLTDNDDSPLGSTFDPYIEYTLPRTGGYLIAVTRYDEFPATSGTFTIQLLGR